MKRKTYSILVCETMVPNVVLGGELKLPEAKKQCLAMLKSKIEAYKAQIKKVRSYQNKDFDQVKVDCCSDTPNCCSISTDKTEGCN